MASSPSHAPPGAHDHGGVAAADDGSVHAHISSLGFYCGIFAGLVVLTILTVKVSYYDFGAFNTVVALVIATMKASLVAAFFMHLRHDGLFNTLAFLVAFLFLAVFILLTYDDVANRGHLDRDYGGTVRADTGQGAPGGMPATSATANEVEGEGPGEAPGKPEGAPKKKE